MKKKYRTVLEELELTQSQFAELLGLSAVTGRRWGKFGPPMPVAILLHFLEWGEVSPAQIKQAVSEIVAECKARPDGRKRAATKPGRA
jgi:hypothetical protein